MEEYAYASQHSLSARATRRRSVLRLWSLGLSIAAVVAAAACQGKDLESEEVPAASKLASDSAAADSVAFAELPQALEALREVRMALFWASADSAAPLVCRELGELSEGDESRRARGTLPDGSYAIVFVRAQMGTGVLRRVELVHRKTSGVERGFIWEESGDHTTAVDWPANGVGGPKSYPIPRNEALPRALRGLGRILLTRPCDEPTSEPPSGVVGAAAV